MIAYEWTRRGKSPQHRVVDHIFDVRIRASNNARKGGRDGSLEGVSKALNMVIVTVILSAMSSIEGGVPS